jgi:hypothetical protein
MKQVCPIEGIHARQQHYFIGITDDLEQHFTGHNAGESPHPRKFKPRKPRAGAFANGPTARAFGTYLKTRSGQAFLKKRDLRKPLRFI